MKRAVSLSMVMLLLIGTLGLNFGIEPVRSEPKTWTVDDDGPADFHMIQEAVDAANDGDTILVKAGRYREHVAVGNKSLSLVGEDRETAIVDGGKASIAVHVTANNTIITGFTVQNSTRAGICLDNCFNSTVSYNNVNNNDFDGIIVVNSCSSCNVVGNNASYNYRMGVQVVNSSECLVTGNVASHNGVKPTGYVGAGIQIWESSTCTMINNTVEDNYDYGIDVYECTNCTLKGNNMTDSQYNFGVESLSMTNFVHDIDASNTVDGKPIYYWVNQHDRRVPSDAGYVEVINSTNIKVENLNLTDKHEGVLLAYTNSSTIKNVHVSFNYYGILVHRSYNCTITGNDASHNRHAGIYLYLSDNCTLSDNNVTYNYPYGIWAGAYCTIIGNNVNNNDIGILGGMYCNISGNNLVDNRVAISGGPHNNIVGNSVNSFAKQYQPYYATGIDAGSHSNVIGNNVTNCYTGIWGSSSGSSSISVIGNNVNNCSYSGVYLSSCHDSVIIANNIYNNSYAIAFDDSEFWASNDNIFCHNNFINNANHTTVKVYNNTWDNGCEGNYWSDYYGNDTDKDGVGDTGLPYATVDYYPLMSPYMLGDVNHDTKVNILDISIIAKAFGSQLGDTKWNPHADIDENGKINIVDISKAAKEFGKQWKGVGG